MEGRSIFFLLCRPCAGIRCILALESLAISMPIVAPVRPHPHGGASPVRLTANSPPQADDKRENGPEPLPSVIKEFDVSGLGTELAAAHTAAESYLRDHDAEFLVLCRCNM